MVNLEIILQHDVCDHMMDHFTLEMIMTMNMVSKKFPDFTKHRKIKDVFLNNFSRDSNFFNKFSKNDKLISCIHDHKIVILKDCISDGTTYKIANYYSQGEYDIEKIFLAIINNDTSYIYFYLFIHNYGHNDTNLSVIVKLFDKYNLGHVFEKFMDQYNFIDQMIMFDQKIKYPWLTISLIAKNHNMIEKILNMYITPKYVYNSKDIGMIFISDFEQFDNPSFLYKYIINHYPEFKNLFDLVRSSEHKMCIIRNLHINRHN